jgi:hypothetical protein
MYNSNKLYSVNHPASQWRSHTVQPSTSQRKVPSATQKEAEFQLATSSGNGTQAEDLASMHHSTAATSTKQLAPAPKTHYTPRLPSAQQQHTSATDHAQRWDTLTRCSVLLSCAVTIAFYALQLLGPLQPPPWQALMTDLFSLATLVAVFIEQEKEAAMACWLGACGSMVLLLAEPRPAAVLVAAAALFAAAAGTYAAKLGTEHDAQQREEQQKHSMQQEGRLKLTAQQWQRWQQGLAVLGGGLLLSFGPSHVTGAGEPCGSRLVLGSVAMLGFFTCTSAQSVAAGRRAAARLRVAVVRAAAAVSSSMIASSKAGSRARGAVRAVPPALPRIADAVQGLRYDAPFWCATLLLISQALGGAVLLLQDAAARAALQVDVATTAMAALCNGLLVPRAWHNTDLMMFTGTCSCALLGAVQLLLHAAGCLCLHALPAQVQAGAVAVGVVLALGLVRAGQLRILVRRAAAVA